MPHLWSEGYRATGEVAGPSYHGSYPKGTTLKEAVSQFKALCDDETAATINEEKLTFWGCQFYFSDYGARG